MSSADRGIDLRHWRNGTLLIRGVEGDFLLSAMQLRMLAHVYREGGEVGCTQRALHAAGFGHDRLPCASERCTSDKTAAEPRSPARRAALSRSLRRLHEHGLILRSRSRITPTATGAALMAELRGSMSWKHWCRDWLGRGEDSAADGDPRSANEPRPAA